jgi:hypothetical protein
MRWLWRRIQRYAALLTGAVLVIINVVALSGILHLSGQVLGAINAAIAALFAFLLTFLRFLQISGVRGAYLRQAREDPQYLVQTAGSMIGQVVGRDELCHILIEDLRDHNSRRPQIVVGGMETGKTALLVRLTQLLAEQGFVPVPVRLRDARDDVDFSELARKRFIADAGTAQSETDVESVWRQLRQDDKIVIVADGLEEALIGSADRDNLIRLGIRQASQVPLVIASRPHDVLHGLQATIIKLGPLNYSAALEYVDRWGLGEYEHRLHWIVQTAGATELPLYLKITHQLYTAGFIGDDIAEGQTVKTIRLDTRGADRAELQRRLLETWMQALIDGHFPAGLALSREDRRATVEQLSLLACLGLQWDRREVRFGQAESLRTDAPPAILAEVDERLGKLGRRFDLRLAAVWGAQLGLVEARGDGVRFPHSIMQAYLASQLIDVALTDADFRERALASSGREFLLALVMGSRATPQDLRFNGTAGDSSWGAQPGAGQPALQQLLCAEARRRTDVKAFDLYAAALQIDCVSTQPAHVGIAAQLDHSWPDIWARDQRTLEEAKLNVVRRFGEAARTISERRLHQGFPAEPAYLQLFRIACREPSHPVRLASAQEIGVGSDEAFDPLAGHLGPPAVDRRSGHTTARPGASPEEEDQGRADRARKEGVIQAWLAPLLVGSVTDRNSAAANKNLDQWLQYLGEHSGTRAESDLRLSLEVALAQGFKHAANRRRRHPHARPKARAYLADQAESMLMKARFWFTRLTLIQALCLWSIPEPQSSSQRDSDPERLVKSWLTVPNGEPEHPFVVEAAELAVLALRTGKPERFLWIDEASIVTAVGSWPASTMAPIKHDLWLPPWAGWTTLDRRAQQLVADVLLLLNLVGRGVQSQPGGQNSRLERANKNELPPCLARNRSLLDVARTAGMVEISDPGSNCEGGCKFKLCPYPPQNTSPYLVEPDEAFCRKQEALLGKDLLRRRAAPWQTQPSRDLRRFWKEMRHRAQG